MPKLSNRFLKHSHDLQCINSWSCAKEPEEQTGSDTPEPSRLAHAVQKWYKELNYFRLQVELMPWNAPSTRKLAQQEEILVKPVLLELLVKLVQGKKIYMGKH